MNSSSGGRTDYIFELLKEPNWKETLHQGQVKPLQWLVYYNDTTALRAVLKEGGSLDSINLNDELGNAAFFGHWKVCDFLINNGVQQAVEQYGRTTNIYSFFCSLFSSGSVFNLHILLSRQLLHSVYIFLQAPY